MPRYVGLDVHKQFIEACFIDEQGKQLHRCRVAVTRESIQTFVAKCLQPSDHVVMETTTMRSKPKATWTGQKRTTAKPSTRNRSERTRAGAQKFSQRAEPQSVFKKSYAWTCYRRCDDH